MAIYIQAKDPNIGLMCFMAVGMAEVSSCEAVVVAGQDIEKGETIGMFHYGGSTHCLIFNKKAADKLTFYTEKKIKMARFSTTLPTASTRRTSQCSRRLPSAAEHRRVAHKQPDRTVYKYKMCGPLLVHACSAA